MGTGHIMRCLALAQAWQDSGGKAIFAMGMDAPALEDRLKSEGMEVVHLSAEPGSSEDAGMTADLARKMGAGWAAVDGYHFGSDYQRIIKESGLRLLFIDDNGHADHYYADIVLNQNLHANEELYRKREPYTKLLLGTEYVLLRREFWPWRGWKREIPEVARKVLVTLGGSDPDNVTLKVIKALQEVEVDGLEALVVIGAANTNRKELDKVLESSKHIRLESNVLNMPSLMAWADIAISAGGSTSWELAFMGMPCVILVMAENQIYVARQLGKIGFAINLGWHEDIELNKTADNLTKLLNDYKTRLNMSEIGPELVDGKGLDKIVTNLQSSKFIKLNLVKESDCILLWQWANDPRVRSASFSSDLINWDEHQKWFSNKLDDSNCFIFVALNRDGIPIGQIRFDLRDEEAEIDFTIDKKYRNTGYGYMLINEGLKEISRLKSVRKFHAYIKPTNEPSLRSFERSGFEKSGEKMIKGNLSIHFTRTYGDE
jgi:UDP-2,4-diacetamido-2,4,6-trideoxy-beta-L-altropyranose hydrolase